MAFASGPLQYMQIQACDNNPNLPSAVNSGLVGVTTNRNNNSYHHSKNSSPNKSVGAYTNKWANDLVRNHPSINRDAVVGFDQSMNRADMIKATRLFKAVFDDPSDPRRVCFAEIIGTLDGVRAIRMDFGDGSVDPATADHTWHLHGAWWYSFWNSWQAADMTLSVLRGESKRMYIDRTSGSVPPVAVEEDEEMILVCQLKGKGTVWKGNGTPGTLMAIHSEAALGGINSGGARKVPDQDSAQAVVDILGTLPGGDNAASVKAVEDAG